jgi:hypothetical protein
MVRYTGPRVRIIRRLGLLPGLTRKNTKNRTKLLDNTGNLFLLKRNDHHLLMIIESVYLKAETSFQLRV